jgi:hypothetical protein
MTVNIEIDVIDAKTGKPVKATIPEPPESFFSFATQFDASDEQIKRLIDRMGVSADTKAMLYAFSKATLRVGRAIVRIGRKIIDTLVSFTRQFPALTFSVVFAVVVGACVTAIPVIGLLLGPLATKLALCLGVVLGGAREFQRADLEERVRAFIDQLRPLAA